MTIKKLLLPILLISGSIGFSQEEQILPLASKVYDANYNMDFEPIADLTYPKAVEQIGGREKFLEKIDNDYQNEKFRKRLQLTAPVFQVNPVKTLNGKTFCVVMFRNPTRVFYEAKLSPSEMETEVAEWKKIAGTKDVFPEPNRNSVNVKRISCYVAVKDESTGGQWKFFNFDDVDQSKAFDTFFGVEKAQLGL